MESINKDELVLLLKEVIAEVVGWNSYQLFKY